MSSKLLLLVMLNDLTNIPAKEMIYQSKMIEFNKSRQLYLNEIKQGINDH